MKAEIAEVRVLQLTLDKEEALWLRTLVQNPLTEDETFEDSEMRRNLFNALSALLGNERRPV